MKGKEIPFKDYAEKETIAKHCKTEQTENETFIDNNKASLLNTSSTEICHSLRLWIYCWSSLALRVGNQSKEWW
jgi:hypothetical protein